MYNPNQREWQENNLKKKLEKRLVEVNEWFKDRLNVNKWMEPENVEKKILDIIKTKAYFNWILKVFKAHKNNLLIATDVAARGLDINNISHVFNYDVPKLPENYVHRIGRTSHMNKRGVAIALCLKDEYEYLCHIEGLIEKEIKEKTLFSQENTQYHNPFY